MLDMLSAIFWFLSSLPLPRHVFIVGDSEAATVCPFTDKVSGILDEVACDYRGGTSIDQWGKEGRLHQAFARWHMRFPRRSNPNVIVLFLGTNDEWRRADQVPDLEPIFTEIGSVPCVWVGPVAGAGRHSPHTAALRDTIGDRCTWVESEDIVLWDGWHPNRENAILWLDRVWVALPAVYFKPWQRRPD